MGFRIGISLIQHIVDGRLVQAGRFYAIKSCLNAIAALPAHERPEVIAFVPASFFEALLFPEHAVNANWLKIVKVPCQRSGHAVNFQKYADKYACDAFFPFDAIPPFHLSQQILSFFSYFSGDDKNTAVDFLIHHSSRIFCMNQITAQNIEKKYPDSKTKITILPFKSMFSSSQLMADSKKILVKHHIHKKYIYLPSAFLENKNHLLVFEAWRQLSTMGKMGEDYLLVCTGTRDHTRKSYYFNDLLAYIKKNQLDNKIRILGFIDRDEQIQIQRNASAILQPSISHGWNITIEEALSLGKRIIAADTAEHREQCHEHAIYFQNNATALAELIRDTWKTLPEGYEQKTEINTFAVYQRDVPAFAKQFLAEIQSLSLPSQNNIDHQSREIILTLQHELNAAKAQLTAAADKFTDLKRKVRISRMRPHKKLLRWILKIFPRPKLGKLNHYPPKPLHIPSYYTPDTTKTSSEIYPSLSIVTPSFNHGAFLEKTLQSVLDQNYPNLEYVIQDGGSEDHTVEILKRYHPALKHWESVKDNGQSNAINLGFRHTRGEIMAYLNSDDLILPGALHYVCDYFTKNPDVDVVYGHRVLIDENDQEIGRWVLPPHDSHVLSWSDFVPQETLFWRRRIWDKVGGNIDEMFHFAMDWDLLLRFRDAGAKFTRLPRFLGAFRIHTQQKTSAQMSQIGHEEMQYLRRRDQGRGVSAGEVSKNAYSYLRRHIIYHELYRAGLLRY